MATSPTPLSVTSSPSEQELMDVYQLLFSEPCSICKCRLARKFYEHPDQVDGLYPRRHIELLK